MYSSVVLIALVAVSQAPDTKGYAGPVQGVGNPVPWSMKVGMLGPANMYAYRIEQVVDDKTVVVSIGLGAFSFAVRGTSTKGLADGQFLRLLGTWKCTETAKVGARTLFILEPRDGATFGPR